jgi:hypothetical protein
LAVGTEAADRIQQQDFAALAILNCAWNVLKPEPYEQRGLGSVVLLFDQLSEAIPWLDLGRSKPKWERVKSRSREEARQRRSRSMRYI